MNRFKLIILSVILLALPGITSAQLVTGRFISSLYGWEKFDTVGVSHVYLRGFQSVLFDVAKNDISFHTHLEGAGTLDSSFVKSTNLRVYNLYVQWKNVGSVADLSLGRQPYFAGVGVGTIDGLIAKVRIANAIQLSAYGGENVLPDLSFDASGKLRDNAVFGGQLLVTSIERARVGISYINRQRKVDAYRTIRADAQFNPIEFTVTPNMEKEQTLGVDASYKISRVNIYGRYDYDLNFKKTLRGQVTLYSNITDKLTASADFIRRVPRVPFNSFFSVFTVSNTDEYEAGVDYSFSPRYRSYVRGAYIAYDEEKSFRYTAGVATHNASITYRGNSGYAGELSSFTIQGTYPFFEQKIIPTIAFSYSSYRLNKSDDKTNTYAAILGATVRPVQLFSLDLQAQWLRNQIVKSDMRFFTRLNLWFSEHMNVLK